MAGRKVEHVGVMVKDIDTSVRFYKEVVGLELKDKLDHSNGVIKLAFLGFGQAGETELELIQAITTGFRRRARCITLHSRSMTLKKSGPGLAGWTLSSSIKKLRHCLTVQDISSSTDRMENGSNSFNPPARVDA